MIFAGLIGFITLLLSGSETTAPPVPQVRVMMVQRQMILRVPVRPHPQFRLVWEEEKGPKCLPAAAIAGAILSGPRTIDIVLRNRQRMRARLDDDCDGLDFYGRFYLQIEDGEVCAKRDVIRSRTGGSCRIEKFRMLVPKVER